VAAQTAVLVVFGVGFTGCVCLYIVVLYFPVGRQVRVSIFFLAGLSELGAICRRLGCCSLSSPVAYVFGWAVRAWYDLSPAGLLWQELVVSRAPGR
jgi:hypothetical protein